MKIALLGDVHANLPALEAVLEHARAQGATAFWNVGDFVGYGPFPDQTVRLLRDLQAVSIAGNYDLKVLKVPARRAKPRPPKQTLKRLAATWSYDHLSSDSRAYLASLPTERRIEQADRRILLCHGSPVSVDEHLYGDTPDARLQELARQAQADLVVCGHSHQAFTRPVAQTLFVNTGSVGRSDDGDARACYALLDLTPKTMEVVHFRVDYDVQRTVRELRKFRLHEAFIQMVVQGRSLDYILQSAQPPEGPVSEASTLKAARRLAEECNSEAAHSEQVTRLALRLFDELADLHGLGPRQRLWLHLAGVLHDIGWAEGRQGHHKTSQRIILQSPLPGLDERERRIVACVARYHRKALPRTEHEPYGSLDEGDRRTVDVLAGLLRVADGLDGDHLSAVRDLDCAVLPRRIIVRCQARFRAETERQKALEKGNLFNDVFRRRLVIQWRLTGPAGATEQTQ